MRVLCYAQHLSGVGHFIRMRALARGLAADHEVYLVDGGRPVPRADDGRVTRLALPIVFRRAGALVAASGAPVAGVMAERARRLAAAVAELRPDAVLVDHYPFSKWELEDEILAALTAARIARPGVKVLCSLRDIAPRTRQEDLPDADFEERVLARLATWFDGLLVHADPAFARLDEHFRRADEITVPVTYTGFVAEAAPAAAPPNEAPPYAILSCGGTRSLGFLRAAIAAFTRARDAGAIAIDRLRVFSGAHASAEEAAELRAAITDPRCELAAFTADFAPQLAAAALSVSRAGYNTTVQLLASGVPAVVVPDPGMSDQGPRARRLAALGRAEVVSGDPPEVPALADALRRALAGTRASHTLRLDGVARTCAILRS
jgi:predicted glycosyltransferase